MRQWAFVFLAVFGILAVAQPSHASSVVSTVETVRTLDGAVIAGWTPPTFWFSLTGVSSAGSCLAVAGRVIFVANTKEMFAVAMTAQLTGRKVQVEYNDTSLVNGFCRAHALTAGEPL